MLSLATRITDLIHVIQVAEQFSDVRLIFVLAIGVYPVCPPNEEVSLNLQDKAVLVAKKVSEIGFFIWLPIGVLWGFSTTQFYRK